MQPKDLARELGVVFRSELGEFLEDPERGVQRVVEDETKSLVAEYGDAVPKTDADKVVAQFTAACHSLVRELVARKYEWKVRAAARRLETEEIPIAASRPPGSHGT